ncbi:cytochrome c family protein [uncultured Cohaesibacter sp.]|uniref:c-type cytochrome n=1 Tax=uncultured Cohaesibacter sp. TaxID=1002546 RepID=UPI00292FCAB3|nr:cytochrome c family protein [uncultured Cohaesibacter sp.]
MNFSELSKLAVMIVGAVVMALIFVGVTGAATGFIFKAETPEKPGYIIEVADASGASPAKEEEKEADFATLLASADIEKGEKVAKKCVACHSFEAGGGNKTGPNLHGVVDRAVATIGDFKYSEAMTSFGEGKNWTAEQLDVYLAKPKDLVPGTNMAFAGLKKVSDRANLIGYISSLSK